MTRWLHSAPWKIQAWRPAAYMHDTRYAYILWPGAQKNLLDPYQQTRVLANSSYRFNTTTLTFTQYHRQTLKMKSYQKLSPQSYLVGGAVPSIFMLRHETLSPYSFNIKFPIYIKLLIHVEGVALNTYTQTFHSVSIIVRPWRWKVIKSCHLCHTCWPGWCGPFCYIHSATHRTQEVRQPSSDLHDIYCLFSPQYTRQHDMQVTAERALQQHRSSTCVVWKPIHPSLFAA